MRPRESGSAVYGFESSRIAGTSHRFEPLPGDGSSSRRTSKSSAGSGIRLALKRVGRPNVLTTSGIPEVCQSEVAAHADSSAMGTAAASLLLRVPTLATAYSEDLQPPSKGSHGWCA